jgi:hypothetical protein
LDKRKGNYLLKIGDIESGRPNLGEYVPVSVYRLMQYTLRDILMKEYGEEKGRKTLYKAGKLAGEIFCNDFLDTSLDITSFITELLQPDIMRGVFLHQSQAPLRCGQVLVPYG